MWSEPVVIATTAVSAKECEGVVIWYCITGGSSGR